LLAVPPNIESNGTPTRRWWRRASTEPTIAKILTGIPPLASTARKDNAMSNLSADPIYPAIEKSKAAWEECVIICDGEPALGASDYGAWHEKEEQVARDFEEAFQAMLATQPTTRLGALALIDVFLEIESATLDNECLALMERLRGFLRMTA
jgi:hypothetical protein